MATLRSLELAKRVWGWSPHSEGQREWLLCDAHVKVGACGRRWGKSESMAFDIVLYALENPGHIQILVAPTDDQTKIIMEQVERLLYSIPGLVKDFEHKKSPYTEITFKDGGGLKLPTTIMARTAGTTGRGLRGRKAHRVIVDEAAFIADHIMLNVVAPLLADFDGSLVEISTPDGRNNFWRDFKRGDDPEEPRYRSFRFPSEQNPYISGDYLKTQKRVLPERSYLQEYEAHFLDSEGAVFRKVEKAARGKKLDGPEPGAQYIFGVDWARSRDFTVIVVFDIQARKMVYLDRFNQIDFATQRMRLTALAEKFKPTAIIAESNSIGLPNIEALQADGLPVQAFLTTNATKGAAVDALVLALEQESIELLSDPVLIGELLAYECKKSATGMLTYSAPDGEHDDTVIATCLAVWGMSGAGSTWADLEAFLDEEGDAPGGSWNSSAGESW